MKKTNFLKAAALALCVSTAMFSCKKDNVETPQEEEHHHDEEGEHTFVRVMVSDQNTTALTMIDPHEAKITSFVAKYPLANLYATASGRHVVLTHGTNNAVEVFNSGLRLHEDHVDVDGDAAMTTFTDNSQKPTHFKSYGTQSLIFNDNEGTLSYAADADFSTANGKFKKINANLLPHHGAMAFFDNNNIAVTSTATSGQSPTSIIVIGQNGTKIHDAKLTVGGLHGNASDGVTAVFGAYKDASNQAGGALVVKQDGSQVFIDNPAGFGAARLATILYAKKTKKFIGYVAAKGAYVVDVAGNKITPLYTGADAFQCKVDYAGENLLVLTLDGKLKIYSLSTLALVKEMQVIGAVASADTYKPVLEATEHFAYIAMPTLGEVHQINLEDGDVIKHKVSANPVRLAVFGFENSETHDH